MSSPPLARTSDSVTKSSRRPHWFFQEHRLCFAAGLRERDRARPSAGNSCRPSPERRTERCACREHRGQGGLVQLDGGVAEPPRGLRIRPRSLRASPRGSRFRGSTALWDSAESCKACTLHRLDRPIRRPGCRARSRETTAVEARSDRGECEPRGRLGYSAIKLHEPPCPRVFAAAQRRCGVPVMVDMNCPAGWAERDRVRACLPAKHSRCSGRTVWPPEDFVTLSEVRAKGGLESRRAENACTAYQFRPDDGRRRRSGHAQPSVIKVAASPNSEGRRDRGRARRQDSSAFSLCGLGFLATLQLMSLARRRLQSKCST